MSNNKQPEQVLSKAVGWLLAVTASLFLWAIFITATLVAEDVVKNRALAAVVNGLVTDSEVEGVVYEVTSDERRAIITALRGGPTGVNPHVWRRICLDGYNWSPVKQECR